MTELMGNTALHGAAGPQKSVTVEDQTSLTEAFEATLKISQEAELPEAAASEETDSREKPEQEDGQAASPPAADSRSKWAVGARCQAVWSEDGRLYPATVASLDGERCRVRFNGYGNEEDVELGALRSPDAVQQTQRQNSQGWTPGSRCRAVYSEDGLVYPAVVLWVKGQRCAVRFDGYDNEEEQDVSSLLNADELQGPGKAAAAKGRSWKSSVTSAREGEGEGGGARRSAWREEGRQNSPWVKEKKRGSQQTDVFPPFPPPPQSGSGGPVSFIPPPPPPLWTFGGEESGSSPASMLMLWYMCGFHTGRYVAQQEFRSKD